MPDDVFEQLLLVLEEVTSDPELKGDSALEGQLVSFLVAIGFAKNQSTVDLEVFISRPGAVLDVAIELVPRPAVIYAVVRNGLAISLASSVAVFGADVDKPVTFKGMGVEDGNSEHVGGRGQADGAP